MAADTAPATVALHPAALDSLLRDALSCADRAEPDGTPGHPHLAGVLLHSDRHPRGGDALIGSATDRFQMVQAATQVSGRLPHPLWLTCIQAEQVLAALAVPLREGGDGGGVGRPMGLAEIVVEGLTVTAGMAAPGSDYASVAVGFPVDIGTGFPDIHALAVKARADVANPGEFAVDATRLARMTDRADRWNPARLRSTRADGLGPVEVMIGDHYAGLITSTKIGGEHAGTPPLWPIPGRPPEAVADRV